MAFDPKKIRRIFLAIAIVLLAGVIGVYSYARYKINKALSHVPEKIAEGITQKAQGFTFTKSENGRKQFSISAGTAIQYTGGLRASLKDVRIVVYGRSVNPDSGQLEDRYDQIYGNDFEYDKSTGEVKANGVVHIDLEHHGTPSDDPMQDHAEPGSIHMKTSGLVFNQNTGLAKTDEPIEFSLPQATGSAKGAVYDSKEMKLTLQSDVRVDTSAEASARKDVNLNAAEIRATRAVITDSPRQAELYKVRVTQGTRELESESVRIFLRPDSTVDHVNASGGVVARNRDPKNQTETRAQTAEFFFGRKNLLKQAVLAGDVAINSKGANAFSGHTGRAEVSFAAGNQVSGIHASNSVNFEQQDPKQPNQSTALQAPAIDFVVSNYQITSAKTNGASQITLAQEQDKTLVTADMFEAKFGAANRIQSLRGTPNAKVVFATDKAGTQRVTTSDEVIARFDVSGKRNARMESVEQNGNFRYVEGPRKASADHARYTPADETITATGSPRFEDSSSGLTVTAETMRFNRRTNSVDADRNVKTTYVTASAAQNGALLGGAAPVHVTSDKATATTAGKARFSGNARLWQSDRIIEAGVIDFDRNARTVVASAVPGRRVQVNFAQTGQDGKAIPVVVTAGKMNYVDAQRKATFTDSVQAVSSDVTMTSRQMDVLLSANRQATGSSGQLDRIIASGNVQLEQKNPVRKGSGSKLEYTAKNAKFVLTAAPDETASIFDAERGEIKADSLTFFSHDDTVQVGSGENTRVVTKTRIKEESRP
ncbi:MAG TPA: LptA/OstA family protein [Terriglobales bacterium]|nr:LptA/OstA family protein [Terriglobales bacterium]